MVRKLAERLAAAWRHSGCSGKGDWRWHPMAERLLGCAGSLVDRQHGVHCGALLTGFLHDSMLDRFRALLGLARDCGAKHELLRRPSRASSQRYVGERYGCKPNLGWETREARNLGATGCAIGRTRE